MARAKDICLELMNSGGYRALEAAGENQSEVRQHADPLVKIIEGVALDVVSNITGVDVTEMTPGKKVALYLAGDGVRQQVAEFMQALHRQMERHLPALYQVYRPACGYIQ
jgi:hypothetical protein